LSHAQVAHALHQRQEKQTTRHEKATSLVAEGAAAIERNDMAAAQASFQQALELEPRNVAAHTYLGVMADRAGNLKEAESHFAQAARFSPESPSARNNYGAILLRLGRTEEAAIEFKASLRADPKQVNALVNLAQIYVAHGTPEETRAARELFAKAQAIAPDAEIARALILTSLRLKDQAAAIVSYRDYTQRLAEASTEVKSTAARLELGNALLAGGLNTEAVAELSAVAESEPQNVEALIALARGYRALGRVAAAGRTLESAVARGIESSALYAELADLYESIGRYENAIPVMRLAVEREPQSENYRFRYALLLINSQAPKAAIIRLEEALKLFPRSTRLWFALGLAHFTEHQAVEAESDFRHVLELDPKATPALAYLGLAYSDQGRYAESIPFYEQALSSDDKIATTYYLLADALLKQSPNETARPESLLVRALALDQTLTPARLALGKLYLRTDRPADALTQLQRVMSDDPKLAEAYYQLGRTLIRLKRADEGKTALDKFKELSDGQKAQVDVERRDLVRRLASVRF
jgi:tetratricopeptide (TPR) repeat protein